MKILIKILAIITTLIIFTIKPSFGNNNSTYKNDEILVKFKSNVPTNSKLKINQKINAKRVRRFKRIKVEQIKLPKDISVEEAIKFYENKKEVEYAEPNYRRTLQATPNDTSFNSLWGLHNTGQTGGTADADIDAPEAWDLSTGSNDVIVAVFDTGVDYTHPDLSPNMWTNPNEIPSDGLDNDGNIYVDDIYGINTAYSGYQPGNPMDIESHGTHVAGTIGAKGDNNSGITGVNWNVKIMAVNTFKIENSSSVTYDSDILKGIDYVLDMKSKGVNIVATNNSYGGEGSNSQSMYNAINNLKNSDILFIAAAGNNNKDNDTTPFYPSNYDNDNVISVAATNSSDNLADFSNYGISSVDIAAPGSTVYSTVPNESYSYKSGTSMATPHVTGLAALIAAYHPEYDYLEIKNAILSSGDAKGSLSGKTYTGARINAYNALTLDVAPPTTSYATQPSTPNGLNNWYKTIPTVSLSKSEPGTTSYSWNSTSSFNVYTSSFTAPKGQNRLYYYSTDENSNSETLKSKFLKVDNTKPRTYAPYSKKVKRYSYARLYYRAYDSYSPSAHITIRIKTLGGVTKKIIYPGWKPINKTLYYNYKASLAKGTYRFFIYAKDTAGNTQYNNAYNKLVIY